ncbi:LamG-like jellyroll fold domain-containing protein [Fibrella arboris]|uniref:LamG-like jellyroll fold domain-containing protein n=1 Tax=Fibrella arboris TaxID=3242486 RepID=UPI0035202E19
MAATGSRQVCLTGKKAAGKYNDRDNGSPTFDVTPWYHIAVTYRSGEMVFYINGTPSCGIMAVSHWR